MQAVIMAAGKGTRMGDLTKDTPKHLFEINGEMILKHTIKTLPRDIDEVIMVIGFLGYKIKEALGFEFDGRNILYIEQKELLGTAHALWLTRSYLKSSKFMVMGGDDWFEAHDLIKCWEADLSLGVQVSSSPIAGAVRVSHGLFDGLVGDKGNDSSSGSLIYKATGVYVLDQKIFDYSPFVLKSGELGLPQTIANMAKDREVKIIEMPGWRQVNSPDDLELLRNEQTHSFA